MLITPLLQQSYRLLAVVLTSLVIGALSGQAMAETTGSVRTSKSISYTSNSVELSARDALLKQAEVTTMVPLVRTGYRAESGAVGVQTETASYNTGDIIIYDVDTELLSDFNHDGFYHRFSVTVDADTVYHSSYVYVMLFLSYEGGPWNHYATSDAYHIFGDSAQDIFIIETELADGFPSGHYDVRVELYEADHDTWMMSYGPYDDVSLSALPLEDSYRDAGEAIDVYPVEAEVIVSGTGALSEWMLVIPVLLIAVRVLTGKADSGKEHQVNWQKSG